jgi:hypothetical protein
MPGACAGNACRPISQREQSIEVDGNVEGAVVWGSPQRELLLSPVVYRFAISSQFGWRIPEW